MLVEQRLPGLQGRSTLGARHKVLQAVHGPAPKGGLDGLLQLHLRLIEGVQTLPSTWGDAKGDAVADRHDERAAQPL